MGRKKRCFLNVIRTIWRTGYFLPAILGLCVLSIVCLHKGIPLELKRYNFTREVYNTGLKGDGSRNQKNDNNSYRRTDQHKKARKMFCRNDSNYVNNNNYYYNTINKTNNKTSMLIPIRVRWSLRNDVMYCPIYKIGTTFWRRVFMIQREPKFHHLRNPFKISFDTQYKSSIYGVNDADQRASSFKFLFTRNPYVRLYSAYVDKVFAPNPMYWSVIGVKAIRLTRPNIDTKSRVCGHDVTFPEFIKHVIHSLENNVDVDPHFVPMETNCRSCRIQYDFIGRMENFAEDSTFILRKLKMNETIQLLEKEGGDLVADDAIRDSIRQAFTSRKKIIHCMTFYDALNRAWSKLKLRGLIGNDTLRLDRVKDAGVTFKRMVELAHASRSKSTSGERRLLKENGFSELWSQVPLSDKIRLRSVYAADFLLFGYNDTPAELFGLPPEDSSENFSA